jgi:hypothetical protein
MRYQKFSYTTNLTLGEELGIEDPKDAVAIFYKRQLLGENEPRFKLKQDDTNLYDWAVDNYLLNADLYDHHSSLYFVDDHRFSTFLLFEHIDLSVENATYAYYRQQIGSLYDKLKPYTFLGITSSSYWKFLPYLIDTNHPLELVAVRDNVWYKSSVPAVFPNNTFNHKAVEEFVYDVYYNRIKPAVRSATVPQNPFNNGIKELVGSNFEEETSQDGQEYLIMFYGDWNPRCK